MIKQDVTSKEVFELLELTKNGSEDKAVVLGFDFIGVKSFIVVNNDAETVAQARMLLKCDYQETKAVGVNDLLISDFQQLLTLVGMDYKEMIEGVDDYASTIKELAVDEGALFSDSKGYLVSVRRLEDNRKLRDVLQGNNEDGIFIKFTSSHVDSSLVRGSHSLTDIRNLVSTKQISALF